MDVGTSGKLSQKFERQMESYILTSGHGMVLL